MVFAFHADESLRRRAWHVQEHIHARAEEDYTRDHRLCTPFLSSTPFCHDAQIKDDGQIVGSMGIAHGFCSNSWIIVYQGYNQLQDLVLDTAKHCDYTQHHNSTVQNADQIRWPSGSWGQT
jgi:hypothetical protein